MTHMVQSLEVGFVPCTVYEDGTPREVYEVEVLTPGAAQGEEIAWMTQRSMTRQDAWALFDQLRSAAEVDVEGWMCLGRVDNLDDDEEPDFDTEYEAERRALDRAEASLW